MPWPFFTLSRLEIALLGFGPNVGFRTPTRAVAPKHQKGPISGEPTKYASKIVCPEGVSQARRLLSGTKRMQPADLPNGAFGPTRDVRQPNLL